MHTTISNYIHNMISYIPPHPYRFLHFRSAQSYGYTKHVECRVYSECGEGKQPPLVRTKVAAVFANLPPLRSAACSYDGSLNGSFSLTNVWFELVMDNVLYARANSASEMHISSCSF